MVDLWFLIEVGIRFIDELIEIKIGISPWSEAQNNVLHYFFRILSVPTAYFFQMRKNLAQKFQYNKHDSGRRKNIFDNVPSRSGGIIKALHPHLRYFWKKPLELDFALLTIFKFGVRFGCGPFRRCRCNVGRIWHPC